MRVIIYLEVPLVGSLTHNDGLYHYTFETAEKLDWETTASFCPIKKEELVVETKTFFGIFPENYKVELDEYEDGEVAHIGRGVYRISVKPSEVFINLNLKNEMGVESVGFLRVSNLQDGGIYHATFGSSRVTQIKIK